MARHQPLENAAARDARAALRIAEIEAAGRDVLLALWLETWGLPAPARTRVEMLRRGLAHRAQEDIYGSLSANAQRRLLRIAAGRDEGAIRRAKPGPSLSPGTRLLREWQGNTHQVTVLDNGFDYRGTIYRSLSHIARDITGTRWSGPLFFGLRGTQARSQCDGA